ncbi:E1 [Kittiwake papillomavirus 2]|uniref:DNA 3'-5' helicase n=1 Tax=Kittiwake papillomavirus 2 TaxID=2562551 RepID=A0AAE5YNB0_9PAPI|nr:E1 [Kittiwake papillomavirus 2]
MDYIITEAEEEGVTSGEEDVEEETEDTGIGTYSQLCAPCSDVEADETDTVHRGLLNQQQQDDDHAVLSQLGHLLGCKRRHRASGGHGDPVPGSQAASERAGLCICDVHVPAKNPRLLQDRVPRPCSTSPPAETIRDLPGRPHRRQGRLPSTPVLAGRVPLKETHAFPESQDNYATATARRPVLVPRTNQGGVQRERGLRAEDAENSQSQPAEEASEQSQAEGVQLLQRILTAKNTRNTQLAVFKEMYGASYTDVTRLYKSDKTQSFEWVIVILGSASIIYEALTECLKRHTEFILYDINPEKRLGLFYVGFLASKNREGVRKCLKHFNVEVTHLPLLDPPNKRSITAALFFAKLMVGHGEMPMWCRDIIAAGERGNGEGFQLSKMVQWAMDHNYSDESEIAFGYAQLADIDVNAQMWLNSNMQAKYVRDATTMVRHYNRGRMHATPMPEHIACRMRDHVDQDDKEGWKRILVFLRYQHVVIQEFLQALKYWFKGRPKKCTIAILGVPDSGKTMFTMSLMQFMAGKVLNYANSKSHFWMQPLVDCKVAAIDDVTMPCWDYINLYMRPALDGNSICIDCKHRAPVQTKCPPLILTSNYDPRDIMGHGDERLYKYLFSRITFVCFNRVIPHIGGRPRFLIQAADWRSFILKYHNELDIDLQGYDYGEPAEDAGGPAGDGECPSGEG